MPCPCSPCHPLFPLLRLSGAGSTKTPGLFLIWPSCITSAQTPEEIDNLWEAPVRKSIASSKKKKVKLDTKTGLLRWGLLAAQVGRKKTTKKEKYKILKKQNREVEVLWQQLSDIGDFFQGAAEADPSPLDWRPPGLMPSWLKKTDVSHQGDDHTNA